MEKKEEWGEAHVAFVDKARERGGGGGGRKRKKVKKRRKRAIPKLVGALGSGGQGGQGIHLY